MTDKTERLSVELNDAFARLEKAQDSPDSKKHSDDGSFEGKSGKGRRSKKIAQPTASGSGSILGVLTGLIAIGIASYSAFHTYQLINNPPSAAIIAEVDLRIEDLRRELELSIQASETARSDVRNQLEELSGIQQISARQFKERLDRSLASIRNDMGTSSEDWLLAEAEYLIRLGNQRVVMQGDPAGSIAFFEAADVIVRDAIGISAFALRKALASDIASLKSVSDLDVDGLFVKLAALIDQVDQLKQHELAFRKVEPPTPIDEPQNSLDQLAALASLGLERVGSLVDYRSAGSIVTPILPPKEEYYLRQNLVMQLQMAQLGLLRSDQQVFAASLSESEEWIVRHFDPQDSTTVAMIVALDELKKINVAREMPDVSGSSREVRKLMASFHEKAGRDTDTEPPKPEPSAAKTPESAPSPAASSELAPELQQGVEVQRTDQLGGEQPGAER